MITKEQHFEATIEADLIERGGYVEGDATDFHPVRGLFQGEVLAFIEKSQPELWAKLAKHHGQGLRAPLSGKQTRFLPFNRGHARGRGQPRRRGRVRDGLPVARGAPARQPPRPRPALPPPRGARGRGGG